MDKIFVVKQGAQSYGNVDEGTWVFLNESDARTKFESLRGQVAIWCNSDDIIWTHLHSVTPGEPADDSNKIDEH